MEGGGGVCYRTLSRSVAIINWVCTVPYLVNPRPSTIFMPICIPVVLTVCRLCN